MEDLEDGQSDAGTTATSRLMGFMRLLPVMIIKIKFCKLCGCACDTENPLTMAGDGEEYGGYRPWGYYDKAKDGVHKVPVGRYCLICLNVFKAKGHKLLLNIQGHIYN